MIREQSPAGDWPCTSSRSVRWRTGVFLDRDRKRAWPNVCNPAGRKHNGNGHVGEPVMMAPAPTSPSRAESRKHVRALITVSSTPPSSRPMVSSRKNMAGPNLLAVSSLTPISFRPGKRNRPIEASAPTYKKMPRTARKKTGCFSRPRLDPMLGGTSACSPATAPAAPDKGDRHENEEQRKVPASPAGENAIE